jgi:hypothetical protein
MSRRRPIIPPRKPIFVGCEGASEAGYAALVGRIARDEPEIHVHVHVELLQPGAGDPFELVERAIAVIREIERRRTAFAIKAVLLDRGAPDKTAAAIRRAREARIHHLVWQDPDHEALLLRHMPDCQQLRPPAGASFRELLRHWPDYEKGMSAQRLAQRIGIEHIRLACTVEAELRDLLVGIGLIAR